MTNAQAVFTDNVLPLFEDAREDFLTKARSVAISIAKRDPKGICTIDMVRAECPPPPDVDPRVMGAVFQCRYDTDPWEKIGFVSSKRKACHGRPVSVFQLKGHGNG